MGRKRKHADASITSSSDSTSSRDADIIYPLCNSSTATGNNVDSSSSNSHQVTMITTSGVRRNSDDYGDMNDGLSLDTFATSSSPTQHPVQRNAANERERARMRVLSRAFTRLKTSLPWVPADTKLSKLDTLRLASCYIAHLSRLLQTDDETSIAVTMATTSTCAAGVAITNTLTTSATTNSTGGVIVIKEERQSTAGGCAATRTACNGSSSTSIHPLNLTWPFTFSSRNGTTVAHFHRSGAPQSASSDVKGSSSSLVTSSINARIKVRGGSTGLGMHSMIPSNGHGQSVR